MVTLSDEHKALFCLLRAGLWNTDHTDLPPFPLTAGQWLNVYRMAVQQTVTGIACRGLQHLPDRLLPPDNLLVHWVAAADRIERRNRYMNTVLGQLVHLLTDSGLHPVVLKGQGMAALYDEPLLRECGDIDLYFASAHDERRAAKLMRTLQCKPERQSDSSTEYRWRGVDVEHHTRLFDIYNPMLRGYLAALVERHGFTESHGLTVPSPTVCLVGLNTHLLKHLMGHGVGLRQFCDMARAYYALHGQYDAEELEEVYRKAGLARWSAQLHAVLTAHLGLPAHCLPLPNPAAAIAPELMQTVLLDGNFGRYGHTHVHPDLPAWQRKLHTLAAYWRQRRFSAAYAPQEAFWTSVRLIAGNIL